MSGHFEAKKIAWRQTKDGLVLALCVHPDDMPQEMALSPLNTRYMIAFSEIGDDENPIDKRFPNGITPQRTPFLDKVQAEGQAPEGGGSPKSSKPFSSLPLSQQAAIRCQDESFQKFIQHAWPSMLVSSRGDYAEVVRRRCSVNSRSDLNDPDKGQNWLELESQFQGWLTDQKYAGVHR